MKIQNPEFSVVGAGLSGSEAALTLAQHGASVCLFEQKPERFSAAHRLSGAAELVCSNSLKSEDVHSAHGLLKAELRLLGSPLLQLAEQARVPGGKALSLDREKFSQVVSDAIESHPLIDWIKRPVDALSSLSGKVLIATGPLSSEALMKDIKTKLGDEGLYFYDATSPVVSLDSLEMEHFFWGSRNEDSDDYLNLPLNKEEYLKFRENLLSAEKVEAHLEEEKLQYFEGCLPIEVLAERGESTLAFSCMKPVGLQHHRNERVHAIIQFRREKASGELLNMVGFQTRMKWPEQIRVFRQLPGMQNAEFVRLGAMHRNSFINAPLHLNESLQLKCDPRFHMAGQITGSEGYTEALATGHYAALQMLGADFLPAESAIQSLVRYLISSDPQYFQPMNFNFGLMPSVQETHDKMKKRRLGKRERNEIRANLALEKLAEWKSSQALFKNISPSMNSRKNSLATALEPSSLI